MVKDETLQESETVFFELEKQSILLSLIALIFILMRVIFPLCQAALEAGRSSASVLQLGRPCRLRQEFH